VKLEGRRDGRPVTGELLVIKEAGSWKVRELRWRR